MSVTNRGLRMQLTNSLTARDKRAMTRDLVSAQEAIESAEEARDKKVAEYYSRGLPLAGLMAATGLGYNTLNGILRAQGVVGTTKDGSADTE